MWNATGVHQVKGSKYVEEVLTAVESDTVGASEREAVLHTLPWRQSAMITKINEENFILRSPLLGFSGSEGEQTVPPTPLHEVGTWRRPPVPSFASKIRLLGAAIHAFAGTFGLQDGRKQEKAMIMLQTLLPRSRLKISELALRWLPKLTSEERLVLQEGEDSIVACQS
ncbi:MAG: hypothetical protein ACREBR_03770 [bacterium]